jgi:hypothetical protein
MRQIEQLNTPPTLRTASRHAAIDCRPASDFHRQAVAAPDTPIEFPPRPDPTVINEIIPLYYIGRNKAGLWVAREAQGRRGGMFLLKRSALRFVKAESEPGGCATIFLDKPFELYLREQPTDSVVALAGPRLAAKIAGCVAAAATAGRKRLSRLIRACASERMHRRAIEKELFGGQCTLSSKNDDDLPVVL